MRPAVSQNFFVHMHLSSAALSLGWLVGWLVTVHNRVEIIVQANKRPQISKILNKPETLRFQRIQKLQNCHRIHIRLTRKLLATVSEANHGYLNLLYEP